MPDGVGITTAGPVKRTIAQILAGFETRQRADISPEVNTQAASLLGQLNGIVGSAIAELWEAWQEAYDAMDPQAALDASLDLVCALTGTIRRQATKSTVTVTLNLNAGVTVQVGAVMSVAGDASARFLLDADVTNSSGSPANVQGTATAETAGPVVANAGTLTVIDTPSAGWNTVTNAADADVGLAKETNEQLRVRREEELVAIGGGTYDGLLADLLKVDAVTSVNLLENVFEVVQGGGPGAGLPPHSFEAVVYQGDDQEVADEIWKNKPLGIQTYSLSGNSETVVDAAGNNQTVYYSRPTTKNLYVAIEYLGIGTNPSTADLQEAMRAAAETPGGRGYLGVGDSVDGWNFLCAVSDLLNSDSRVTRLHLSWTSSSLPSDPATDVHWLGVGSREVALFDTARTSVSVAGP